MEKCKISNIYMQNVWKSAEYRIHKYEMYGREQNIDHTNVVCTESAEY